MLLHFIYDIPANFQQFVDVWNEESQLFQVLNNYVLTAVFLSLPVVALAFVIKKPVYEHENTVQISGATKEDVEHRTRRYEDLIRTLARR